jgi:GT2 family glycosyltransferase
VAEEDGRLRARPAGDIEDVPRVDGPTLQVRAQPVYGPAWISTIDRAVPFSPISVSGRYVAARLLVTVGSVPVGMATVRLDRGHASADRVCRAVHGQLGPLRPVPMPTLCHEPVTAVVATRGRPNSLARCVRSILAGDHPAITVLVVDNDPDDDRTAQAVQALRDPRVRYIRESRRGASVGRNRGLFEADTQVVLFTDDDTEVDRAWAVRMAGAFAKDPTLACTSGPVLAARLDTEQERAADTALAWNKGFLARRFSLQDPPPDSAIFPFSPGLFGIGANMAVRTRFAQAAGGFDEALGPGTPTHGGEDGEFMIRLILAGHAVGYEPSALLWHHHRVDGDSMRVQLRGYAVGLSALLTKIALDRQARHAALRRLPAAVAQMRTISEREADAGEGMPEDTARLRVGGTLRGPGAYVMARRAVRRAGGRVPALSPASRRNTERAAPSVT